MSYRIFDDPEGNRWQVWLVSPKIAERRRGERRVGDQPLSAAGERRLSRERRTSLADRASLLPSSFAGGWLCFESDHGEKRRLHPVPDAWDSLSDELLWGLTQKATAVSVKQLR